jgi:nucleoside-diphosphate-sugar epimerase
MSAGRPRAVVFGGAGFIGSHLVSRLSGDGYDVTLADAQRPKAGVPNDVQVEVVDVRRPISISVSTPDIVFNLAAIHRTPGHLDNEYYDTNVAGALNVTRWCTRMEARSLLFTSSISVYGPGEEPRDEESEPTPNSAYGRSKLLAEQIHHEWASTGDYGLVIVRPAVVFGPREHGNFTRLANALNRRRFAYPGRDDTVKACGYIGDLIESMLFGLNLTEQSYTYNFCYPEPYTIREICDTFSRVAGYPSPVHIPAPLMRAGLAVLKLVPRMRYLQGLDPDRIRKLTASTNIRPRALEKSGFIWPTTLSSALQAWLAAPPAGTFV